MIEIIKKSDMGIQVLEKGTYCVREGMIAVIESGLVIVRENRAKYKRVKGSCRTCSECKHHGMGRDTHLNDLKTEVCFLHHKNSKVDIYYKRRGFEYACGAFEPKENSDK